MSQTRKVYCIRCGRTYLYSGDVKSGQCPNCKRWGTLYEVKIET